MAAFLLVFAAAAPAAETAVQQARPAVDDVVRYFDTIVFGAEVDKSLAQTEVAKWQEPIRISIQGRPTPQHRRFVEAHAQTLAALTGLSFQIPADGHNFYIVFVRRAEMAGVRIPGVPADFVRKIAAQAGGGCFFITAKKPASRIVHGVIVVNSERDDALTNHCLLEEMTQSLGLPNDSDQLRPSLFSDRDHLVRPSRIDEILVRTLYDRRMTAGLPRRRAIEVARAIVAELDRSLP